MEAGARDPGVERIRFLGWCVVCIVALLVSLLAPVSALSSPPSDAYRFLHDADGRLKAAVDPEGDTALYNWDAAGNLLSITRHSSSKLALVQLSPQQGEVGATVTIQGIGFSTTTGLNTVKFNGPAATVITATPTALTVKVPSGATSGSVTVSTPEDGPATSPESFEVTESGVPHISSLSPNVAVAGEEITATGSNLEPTIADNSLMLNGIRPEMTSAAASAIKFKVPTGTLGGRVTVATPEGSDGGPDIYIPPKALAASKVGSTARVSLGESKSVSFAGSEKVALVLFDGTAGQRFSLKLFESTLSSGVASVFTPSGQELQATSFTSGGGGFVGPLTLPVTGTYTVLLSPSGASAGSVKLSAFGFDNISGALTPAATAEGTQKSVTIATPGQEAHYSVSATAGQAVSLKTSSSAMSGEYSLEWLDPEGKVLQSWSAGGSQNGFKGAVPFPTTGTYTLVVNPKSWHTGSVTLTAWDASPTTATLTPSPTGDSKTITTSVPGQGALITFSGVAGQRFFAVLSEVTLAGGWTSLKRPNGKEIEEGPLSKGTTKTYGPVTLPETGTYTIAIVGTGESTGSVKATAYGFEDITGSISPPATAEGAQQSVSIATPGQEARYSVSGTAGQVVSLKRSSSAMSGSYKFEWVSPEGKVITSWSSGGSANGYLGVATFPTAGTYTLAVNPESTYTGSVILTAWDASPAASSMSPPTSTGSSKTLTTTVPGQTAHVTFSGTAGQQVSAVVSEVTFASGWTSLKRPNGKELSEGSLAKGSSRTLGPVTLPETGTYTIGIAPSGESTGSAKVSGYLVENVTGTITPTTSAEGAQQSLTITTPGQEARYSVEASAGQIVSLKASNSSFNGRYYLEWINSSGKVLASTSWNGTEGGYLLRQAFASAGTYSLAVNPEGATTGSLTLTAWDALTHDAGSITPSAEGASKTLSVTVPGGETKIVFGGTAGQQLRFDFSEISFSGHTAIKTPAGTTLSGGEAALPKGGSKSLKPGTLPSTGTYTIWFVPHFQNGETGSAKLTAFIESPIAWFRDEEPETVLASFEGITQGGPYSDEAAPVPTEVDPVASSSMPQAPDVPITPRMREFDPDPIAIWHPPRNIPGWEAPEPKSPWDEIRDLEAPPGMTALAGQVLQRNGLPLAGAQVSMEGTDSGVETDEAGRFLVSGVPAGHQALVVNGESVPGERRYGSYEVNVDLAEGETTILDYTLWLSPLDPDGNRRIESPTKGETSLTTPSIPGLEVKIPAGTVIRNATGETVEDLNITAIPVNQAPFPLPPFVPIPVYFTIQPGRAYLSKGAQIVYPNWGNLRPGQRAEFWNYDAEDRGWYVYGRGTVSPDGKQVVPDPGVRVWQFTGAMLASSPLPPATAPTGEASSGDPVDLYSGLFMYHKRDVVLPDTIPIDITRTYRPGDSNSYSFGIGTTNPYDMRLWSGAGAAEANLIMPDGQKIHYVRTTPGTGFSDGAFRSTSTPGPFYGSTLNYSPSSGDAYWNLNLTNGMTYVFGVGRLLEVRDNRGNNLVITRSGENITQITSPHGRWVKFTYDGSNRITELADNGGRKVKYTYTSGRLTKVEDPAGRATEYEYDGSGRMKAVINARGNKYLQIAYDANGRVEKQTAGDGATFGFVYQLSETGKVRSTTVTDPRGSEKRVTFNSEGRVTGEMLEPGSEYEEARSFELQPETGLRLAETDPLGRTTEFEYDSNGNVTEVTQLAGTEEAQTTKLAYQPGTSWLTEIIDPLGHAVKYEYGAGGELLKRTDALGHATAVGYDSSGQIATMTNATSETTHFGYTNGDLTSVTDPLGRTTSRFVDGVGRVRAITTPGGERTRYFYNAAGELTSITSPSGATTSIEYDADGNPVKVTDPRGKETTMAYDVMDRLIVETDPLGNSSEWDYDKAGDLIEAVDRNGEVSTFSYDPLRRLETARFGVSGLTAESTIDYEYDNADRLTNVDDSTGGEYAITRDPFGRVESLTGPTGTVSNSYDAAGRRELMSASGLEPLAYTYDNADRLIGLSRGAESVDIEYDKADRPTLITLPNGIEEEFGYDAGGQLTAISYQAGTTTLGGIQYAYDANGRQEAMWGSYARLDLPQALSTAEYNADNELVKRGAVEFSYDKEGRLLSDGANEYSWSARGELTGISGEVAASFTYDPFGRRTSKTFGVATTELLYDGANVVAESKEEEEEVRIASLLSSPRPDQLFARTTMFGTDSYLTDRLGSTVALADSSAELTTAYTYEPFGAPTATGPVSDNPYQFTGRENDGTGLQYNRARYYSFEAGRFISQDPAGFAGSGTNLYWYGYSDPLDFTDPSGMCGYPVCAPDPLGSLGDLGNDVKEQVGDWVSGAPSVASDAATWVEGAEDTAMSVGKTAWNESYRTFWCIAESVSKHEDEIGCYQEHNEPGYEDPPDDDSHPPLGPPPVPGTGPKPVFIP